MIKTLQGLVDKLNDNFSKEGNFYLFYDDDMENIYLFRQLSDVCFELAEISKKYKSWLVGKDLYMQVGEVQKYIMNFLVNSNTEDWFDDNDEIVVDGIQMTKKEADQLYEYFTKKQAENLNKEIKRLDKHFDKVRKLWNM